MLVTDNIPSIFESIFEWYNRPHKPARVFTFLTGTEVGDTEPAKWMACENKGYFSQVTNMAEVKDSVLRYISVLARPMVLLKDTHPVKWTTAYADLEEKQGKQGYSMVTSVSSPVYSQHNYTTMERLGLKPKELSDPHEQIRTADLLGVVGIDVPIIEIEKLLPPHKLGVNGYSFALNNNGHLLFHPDLRPTSGEILKPDYNIVDLAEVELVHDKSLKSLTREGYETDEPRYNHSGLFKMRKEMVDHTAGQTRLTVKVHQDEMRRAVVREQDYFYVGISTNTPFSLGIAVPSKYGHFRVMGGLQLDQQNTSQIFSDERWSVHPGWVYCKFNFEQKSSSQKKVLKHFLKRMEIEGSKFKYGQPVITRHLPGCTSYWGPAYFCKDLPQILSAEENPHFCDKELVQALALDGEITKVFSDANSRNEVFAKFGTKLAFVATRSGLTRWEKLDKSDDHDDVIRDFSDMKAVDELWYKRVVEYHHTNPHSYLLSVEKDPRTVTASHAIYKGQAPAAVVGAQLDYAGLADNLWEVTKGFKTQSGEILSCQNETINCFVLDNNGFVTISEDSGHVGKFFGQVDALLFETFLQHGIFEKIKIYDYQAVCFENVADEMQSEEHHEIVYDDAESKLKEEFDTDFKIQDGEKINKTKAKSCDKETYIYELKKPIYIRGIGFCEESRCEKPFAVSLIPHTNLLLVVSDALCPCTQAKKVSVIPSKVEYETICATISHQPYRQKPRPSIFYHPQEEEIRLCGDS